MSTHRSPCGCPICVVSRSLRSLEDATEEWLEREAALEMEHAYMLEVVDEILAAPWWKPQRKRLRKARRCMSWPS